MRKIKEKEEEGGTATEHERGGHATQARKRDGWELSGNGERERGRRTEVAGGKTKGGGGRAGERVKRVRRRNGWKARRGEREGEISRADLPSCGEMADHHHRRIIREPNIPLSLSLSRLFVVIKRQRMRTMRAVFALKNYRSSSSKIPTCADRLLDAISTASIGPSFCTFYAPGACLPCARRKIPTRIAPIVYN